MPPSATAADRIPPPAQQMARSRARGPGAGPPPAGGRPGSATTGGRSATNQL
jgi:hypothetical protein